MSWEDVKKYFEKILQETKTDFGYEFVAVYSIDGEKRMVKGRYLKETETLVFDQEAPYNEEEEEKTEGKEEEPSK